MAATGSKNGNLRVAPRFTLPPEAVTETFAFLGKRGSGKSSAAVTMAEEMDRLKHQWVAVDPKGDWWGIRSSADGKGPGLAVLVLGGRHGDLPLEASAGALIAELVIEQGITAVLDVSLFSKTEQIRFVTDFAETLFRRIGDDPRPLHLFLEEAEEFLPQRVESRAARMVGAYSKIAKQGRTFGLGVSLITQRSASLNKDALSQTDTLVLFRTPSPHDRKAVIAWADYHGEAQDIAESLGALLPGESWILSPGFLGSITRIRWNLRSTFDSGSTPVVGKRRAAPMSLADIDLAQISALMAETVERVAETDPKALRKKVRDLEAELAKAEAARAAAQSLAQTAANSEAVIETVVEQVIVEVPVVPDGVAELVDEAVRIVEQYGSDLSRLTEATVAAHSRLLTIRKDIDLAPSTHVSELAPVPTPAASRPATAAPSEPAYRPSPRPAVPPRTSRPDTGDDVKLGKRERSILTVLAQYPEGRTQRQIALLTGYSPKSSTIGAGLSNLRKHGYVTSGGPVVQSTPEGVEALGDFEVLPTGRGLYDYWMTQLGARERAFLAILVDAYPDPMSHAEIAELTEYSPESSTIGAGMSKLRGLGLVEGWAASADFMGSIEA